VKVKIDLDNCHMSGECYYNHPELFKMGDGGHPVVLVTEVSDEAVIGQVREAIEVCPAVAISLEN
jgi:ferredoxin